MFGSKMLAVALTAVIGVLPAVCQQQTAPPQATVPESAATQGVPAALSITDVRGDGATGRVRERAPQAPSIRVTDDKGAPISGAAVVFTLPTEGATGVFGNGAKSLAVVTDRNGTAVAQGLRFNEIPGKVQVHINASYKGRTARASVTQYSEAPAGYKPTHHGGSGKIIAIVAVLAAGGAAGAVVATRKSSTSNPTAPPTAPVGIGITPGTGAVAPPF